MTSASRLRFRGSGFAALTLRFRGFGSSFALQRCGFGFVVSISRLGFRLRIVLLSSPFFVIVFVFVVVVVIV